MAAPGPNRSSRIRRHRGWHDTYPPIAESDWALLEALAPDFRGWVDSGPRGIIDVDRPAHLEMHQTIHRWFTPKGRG